MMLFKNLFFAITFLLFFQNTQAQSLQLDWAKTMGGVGGDVVWSTTLDACGHVLSVGSFEDTTDFDPNVGIASLISNGGSDVFIQKLDTAGNFIWAKSIGNTGSTLTV